MMISTRGRYALRVIIDLAEQNSEEYIPLKDIVARQDISQKYVEGIMTQLSKNNLVEAVHGKNGGYSAAGNADGLLNWPIWSAAQLRYFHQYAPELFYGCFETRFELFNRLTDGFHHSDCGGKPGGWPDDRADKSNGRKSAAMDSPFRADAFYGKCFDVYRSFRGNCQDGLDCDCI